MLYDSTCQYPVKAGQKCVNKHLCQTLQNWNNGIEYERVYWCSGDREVVLEHEGREKTIERIMSDQRCRRTDWCDWVEWAVKESVLSEEENASAEQGEDGEDEALDDVLGEGDSIGVER